MIPIESLDDPRVAAYRDVATPGALADAGLFVAEGRLVVRRLLALPRYAVHSVLVTPAAREALADLSPAAPVYVAPQPVLDAIVGFNIHRGCLALAARPRDVAFDDLPWLTLRRVLVLEGVNNPDNVGGIFRSAAAFGVDAVVLGPGCGDPLYRKAVRTSMAATLQVPYVHAPRWPDAIATLGARGLVVLALTPASSARPLDDVARGVDRLALLVGTEGAGLSAAALDAAGAAVRIRITPEVDSLNVAVATSIALHHFFMPAPRY